MNQRMYYSQEAAERAAQQRLMMAIAVLALGLGMGTVLAMLFAPRTGEETRRSLAEGAASAVDGGREVAGKAIENLQREFDKLRKEVEERVR